MSVFEGPCVGPPVRETEHKVMAPVEGVELPGGARVAAGGRPFLPRSIQVKWRRNTAMPEWRSGWVVLYGPQVRQDGSLGTRELSQTIWMKPDGAPRDVSPEDSVWPIPAWVLDFYRASRPGGVS